MKKILFLLPLLLLLSCSVQKRKYQKGFFVEWHKHNNKTESLAGRNNPRHEQKVTNHEQEVIQVIPSEKMAVQAAAKNELTSKDLSTKHKVLIGDEPCDELIFKDGTELKVRVTEISSSEIKYKKCDNPDGPVYVTKKSELFMIKYGNGTREVFKTESPQKTTSTYQQPPRTHPLAVAALILGILAIYPLSILAGIPALILANKALSDIKNRPGEYKGEGMATAGKVLAWISIGIVLLVLLIFLIAILSLA